MLKTIGNAILISFIAMGATQGLAAEGGGGGYGNLIFGISVPDSANTQMHTVYGFTGGSRISSMLGVGGYHFQSSEEDGTGTSVFSYSMTGLEGRVNISSGEKNIFIGLRAGVTKVTSTGTSTDVIFSPYHYGFVSGYNFVLWKVFSVGFEGSFIEIEKAEATSGSTTLTNDPFHTINFFATLGISF